MVLLLWIYETKTFYKIRSNKPIMEKKRRARINHCLNELKTLILEAMKKDPARHTKLEKADILEMTVKYLQTMQRNQINAANNVQNDPTVLYKFKAGFSDCTNEVSRYINQIDGVDATVKQRLMGHLNNCVTGIQQVATPQPYSSLGSSTNTNFPYRPSGFSSSPDLFGSASSSNAANPLYQQLPLNLPVTPEINNNSRIQMGGVQFIPSRLPSGEFALVMPNTGNTPEQWKQYYPVDSLSLRHNNLDLNESLPRSAFSNVTKMAKHLDTSPLSPASSMSSIDDSSTTQTDLQTSIETSSPQRTPPKCLSAFPTPPSGGSITLIPTTTTTTTATHSTPLLNSTITSAPSLQQQHVTSTTEQSSAGISSRIKPISLEMCMKDSESETIADYKYVDGKKRPHSNQSAENEDDDDGEPLPKIRAKSEQSSPPSSSPPPPLSAPPMTNENAVKSEESSNDNDQSEEAGNGDMWRPW
ncbi:protein deadpan-like isoform X2 [Sitodiplosis mosellana]|uniref:protein deadpan-like isoform X2 n=1 Tax=Sitodiplosis mosellana TaxID=263140 RepID=UPI002444527D|nr:protein deadpan-like isoform X2 [Sitodiplosis mosellana]